MADKTHASKQRQGVRAWVSHLSMSESLWVRDRGKHRNGPSYDDGQREAWNQPSNTLHTSSSHTPHSSGRARGTLHSIERSRHNPTPRRVKEIPCWRDEGGDTSYARVSFSMTHQWASKPVKEHVGKNSPYSKQGRQWNTINRRSFRVGLQSDIKQCAINKRKAGWYKNWERTTGYGAVDSISLAQLKHVVQMEGKLHNCTSASPRIIIRRHQQTQAGRGV